MKDGTDRWHRWLLEVRFGGDAAGREKDLAEFLYPVRDAVLDRARLSPARRCWTSAPATVSSRSAHWNGLGPRAGDLL